MSRIDKALSSAEELEKVKGEIVSEVRRGTKPRGKGTCALILLTLVLAGALWAAWAVASTGLVAVPVLTGLAYEKPEPSSRVEAGVPLEAFVASRLATSGGTFSIPESTLTTFVRDTLATSGQTLFDESGAQASVNGAHGIELYLPLRDNALQTAVVATVRFGAKDGALTIAVDDVSVGSWHAWSVLRDGVMVPALAAGLESVNQTISDAHVTVVGVSEQAGMLVVQATLSTNK